MDPVPATPGRKTWNAVIDGLLVLCILLVPGLAGTAAYDQWITPTMDFFLESPGSSTVGHVASGGHSAAAGLEAGDVILTADDIDFRSWSAPQIGATHLLKVLRRGEIQTLAMPAVRLSSVNFLPLAVTLAVTLVLWGAGSMLLVRRFRNPEIRLFFLVSNAAAIAVVFPFSYGDPWRPPDRLLSISFAGFCLLAPLILHYAVSHPVKLGNHRFRLSGLIPVYALSLVPVIGWGLEDPFLVRGGLVFFCMVLAAAAALAFFSYRHRTGPEERRRYRIIYSGAAFSTAFFLTIAYLPGALQAPIRLPIWAAGPALLIAPLIYLFATLRYNLFGIDRLVNRSLVYAVLSLGIFILYILPYLALFRYVPDDLFLHVMIVFLLTLWVGWTFNWMRTRVQRLVDRLFYGGWYDFAAVVETVSDELARSYTRGQITRALTTQVPRMMHFRRSSLWMDYLDSPAEELEEARFRVVFDTPVPAAWTVDAHLDGDDLSSEDLRILQTLARQAEIALNNALAIEKLQSQLEDIRGKREELAQAQRRLLQSREEERLRLARDLHDNPIQSLVGLNIQLGLLLHEKGPAGAGKQALVEMQLEVRRLISELRQVCAELRPPMLDALGLSSAISALFSEWAETNPVNLRLDLCPDSTLRRLPPEIAVNLYRIAQEALSNISRHANASRVDISLASKGEQLKMVIIDDGIGFDPSGTFRVLDNDRHFGLVGMQERVNLIGADLRLDSSPGKGTVVTVVWPVTGEEK